MEEIGKDEGDAIAAEQEQRAKDAANYVNLRAVGDHFWFKKYIGRKTITKKGFEGKPDFESEAWEFEGGLVNTARDGEQRFDKFVVDPSKELRGRLETLKVGMGPGKCTCIQLIPTGQKYPQRKHKLEVAKAQTAAPQAAFPF